MTHVPEDEFVDDVARFLRYHYAPDDLDESPTLPSGRRPDFVLYPAIGPGVAVEVENEPDVTYESVGQALAYAGELDQTRPDAAPFRPAVIVPDHDDPAEPSMFLRDHVEFVAVPVGWSAESEAIED